MKSLHNLFPRQCKILKCLICIYYDEQKNSKSQLCKGLYQVISVGSIPVSWDEAVGLSGKCVHGIQKSLLKKSELKIEIISDF